MVASRMVKGKANAKFKSYGVGKKAFKISSAKLDEHRFHIRSNQKLVLEGFGTIRMAENPRFASEPISVEILSHNNRLRVLPLSRDTDCLSSFGQINRD